MRVWFNRLNFLFRKITDGITPSVAGATSPPNMGERGLFAKNKGFYKTSHFTRKFQQVVILLIIAALGLSACGSVDSFRDTDTASNGAQQVVTATPIPTAPAAARPTYTVQRGTVQEELTFTGRWRPRDQTTLSFPIGGTVSQVNVRRGDAITAGTLLAQYDTSDLENQLASAQINLETAQTSLNEQGTSGTQAVEDATINLANANLSLQNSQNSLPWTSVASARLNLDTAEDDLYDAERSYFEAISDPTASASVVDNAYQQLQNAKKSLASAEYSYFSAAQNYNSSLISLQQQENSVISSGLSLDRAQNNQTTADDASVRSAQLSIDSIEEDIANSSLYAPMDGVVLEVNIAAGDAASAYETVIVIGIPEPLEVIASLAFSDTQQLSVGMVGACEVANQPETAVGCVVRQIPLTNREADQTTRVAASLDDVADGQLIEVTLPLDVREDVLWLPPAAIRTFQNRIFVVLDTPTGDQVVDITIGLQTDDRVEITSGVNEGDVVIAP